MTFRLSTAVLLLVVATALAAGGCTPPDNRGDNGDYDPVPGGQGIPEGTYAGTLECTETTSLVQEGQDETLLGQTTPSFSVAFSFDDSGGLLDSNRDPIVVGSTDSTTISGQTATGTVRSVDKAVDRLEVVADATATVEVTGYGTLPMIGVVTAVYEFAEPNTVTLVTDKVFTSNLVDSQFIKIVAECSATLPYQ
ncbi:MAG TPA: hypothetical protein PLL20_02200 [Phycisphaerae bacterium]|nr:hypothetical protein [Phycisphaerae bacterium]HRR84015.1 hypothetical protein [Phycisphaerae bacterium]